MTTTDVIAAAALLMMVMIAVLLLVQYLKLHEVWETMVNCRTSLRWARIQESENKELRSALRAQKAHVDQLQRKVNLLEELVPERK
jgi:cell division protein FtsB